MPRKTHTGAARKLATTEARDELPKLVNEMRQKDRPSRSLLDSAIEIGPHRKGGAMLVPEVDVLAHVRRQGDLEHRVEELEDTLEDLLLANALDRMYANAAATGSEPVETVVRELGFEDLLEAGE
jgi:hypothetical protein